MDQNKNQEEENNAKKRAEGLGDIIDFRKRIIHIDFVKNSVSYEVRFPASSLISYNGETFGFADVKFGTTTKSLKFLFYDDETYKLMVLGKRDKPEDFYEKCPGNVVKQSPRFYVKKLEILAA